MNIQFHRKMAYQVCIVELLALDFDEIQLAEIVKNHHTEMCEGFLKSIPYYLVAKSILDQEYHNEVAKEAV